MVARAPDDGPARLHAGESMMPVMDALVVVLAVLTFAVLYVMIAAVERI